MGFYKKKPLIVEAREFTGDNWQEIRDFVGSCQMSEGAPWVVGFGPSGKHVSVESDSKGFMSHTAELWVAANKQWLPIQIGEWIIKDSLGFYPCQEEKFEETYRPDNSTDDFPSVDNAFSNAERTVISWEGENFYKSCDALVTGDPVNGPASYCVKRVDHLSWTVHEDWNGATKAVD